MIKVVLWSALLVFVFGHNKAIAQFDSTYYVSYDTMIAGRFYFSQKYTAFRIIDKADDVDIRYLPNTTLNMGVGATYGSATLNLAYGFGFLNPDKGQGETDYLDLQAHFYGRKWLFDFYGQFYNGFYSNDEALQDADGNYYVRPDIKVREFGMNAQYMLNSKRFSYRAGFFQNEWQKKSAGTMLLGWQILSGISSSDSSFVPAPTRASKYDTGKKISFFGIGPTVGYAYTLVIKKHFFVMASSSITASYGYDKINSEEKIDSSFDPNLSIKAFAGYNRGLNAICITFTNDTTIQDLTEDISRYWLSTGNLRINFVHRFAIKKPLFQGILGILGPTGK